MSDERPVVAIESLAPDLTDPRNRIVENGNHPTEPDVSTLKVAIVGTATGQEFAPYADKSWEIWGLSRSYLSLPRWTRWFELHKPQDLCKTWTPGNEAAEVAARSAYTTWLGNAHNQGRVYTREAAIPNTEDFPFAELVEEFPRGYFTNTVSWLIAYAAYIGVAEIGLWGVDMALDTEYGVQRPSVEYLLGIAEGRGIKVTVAESSDILKCKSMYAYEDTGLFTAKLRVKILEMEQHKKALIQEMTQATNLIAAKEGALDAFKYIQMCWGEEG